jgi:chromosome segregation ATPase
LWNPHIFDITEYWVIFQKDLIEKLDKGNSDITTIRDQKSESENQKQLLQQKFTSTENNLDRVEQELSQAHLDTTRSKTDSNEREEHRKKIQEINDDLNDQLDKQMENMTTANDQIESLKSSETLLKDENKELQSKIEEVKNNKTTIEKTLTDSIAEKQSLETLYNPAALPTTVPRRTRSRTHTGE